MTNYLDWRVCWIGGSFVLFQFLVQRVFYYYLPTEDSTAFPLLVFNISFVGFSLGMLLRDRLASPQSKAAHLPSVLLSANILLSCLLIQKLPHHHGFLAVLLFPAVLLPALLFGIQICAHASQEAPRFLFSLSLGTVGGVLLYNHGLAYVPFHGSFLAVSLLPLGMEAILGRVSRAPVTALAALLSAFSLVFLRLPTEGVVARYFTPLGVTEVDTKWEMTTDQRSPTHIAKQGDLGTVQPHARIPYLLRRPQEVLVIGAGGGQDLVAALHFGARKVVGVEMNKTRIQLMRGRYVKHSNALYLNPRIEIVEDEARHALRYMRSTYDLIVVQRPWTTHHYDRFTLQYSRQLMTLEAIREYCRLLKDNGLLFITLPYNLTSRQYGFIASGFRRALPRAFLENHLVLLEAARSPARRSKGMLVLLFCKTGFHPKDKERLRQTGLHLLHFPGDPGVSANSPAHPFFSGALVAASDKILRTGWRISNTSRWIWFGALALIPLFLLTRNSAATRFSWFTYLALGIIYFWLEAWLILRASFFIGDAVAAYQLVLICFVLCGGLGYLHAARLQRAAQVQLPILMLLALLVLVSRRELLWDQTPGPLLERFLVASICGVLGYLSAFPFGYLLAYEPQRPQAYAWDSLGLVLGYPVFLMLLSGPFDTIGLYIAIAYGLIAVRALCRPEK